jgi:hypothetical protein
MPTLQRILLPRALDGALAAALWFEPTPAQLEALKAMLASGVGFAQADASDSDSASEEHAPDQGRCSPAAILLRRAVPLTPPSVRPYFAVCALEAWRRVPIRQLAGWSGIPFSLLKRRLAARALSPAGVAAWNFALHATWLLDVAQLPASTVVSCMRLGRPAALGAVLGARGVPFFAGQVRAGAFSSTLERYLDLLRASFGA